MLETIAMAVLRGLWEIGKIAIVIVLAKVAFIIYGLKKGIYMISH